MLFSNFAILLWSWMQLFRMRRTGDTEWDIEGLLPVSFAPLINCKEDKKEFPQFIEIRKCTTWNPNLNHLHQLLHFTMDLTLYILMFAFLYISLYCRLNTSYHTGWSSEAPKSVIISLFPEWLYLIQGWLTVTYL